MGRRPWKVWNLSRERKSNVWWKRIRGCRQPHSVYEMFTFGKISNRCYCIACRIKRLNSLWVLEGKGLEFWWTIDARTRQTSTSIAQIPLGSFRHDSTRLTCQARAFPAFEMTCIVSSGALNSTHSLTRAFWLCWACRTAQLDAIISTRSTRRTCCVLLVNSTQ